MEQGRVKLPPVLFPGMGSPIESEIRRIEFDAGRGTRAGRGGAAHERS